MMGEIIESILGNEQLGVSTIFLALTVGVFYYLRKDTAEHRKEYKETVQQMFQVVEKNTEANTKLSQTIDELRHELRR
jgi:predicted metalloendopeptidase